MKKLVLGFAIAVSLMVGIAGSAGATGPDDKACSAAGGAPPFASTLVPLLCEVSVDHRA